MFDCYAFLFNKNLTLLRLYRDYFLIGIGFYTVPLK